MGNVSSGEMERRPLTVATSASAEIPDSPIRPTAAATIASLKQADRAQRTVYSIEELPRPSVLSDYSITNQGKHAYYVQHNVQKEGDNAPLPRFSFRDAEGNEVAVIQAIDTWTCQVYRDRKLWAQFSANPYDFSENYSYFCYKRDIRMDFAADQSADYKVVLFPNHLGSQEYLIMERTVPQALAGKISYSSGLFRTEKFKLTVEADRDDDVALLLISIVLDLIYTDHNSKEDKDDS